MQEKPLKIVKLVEPEKIALCERHRQISRESQVELAALDMQYQHDMKKLTDKYDALYNEVFTGIAKGIVADPASCYKSGDAYLMLGLFDDFGDAYLAVKEGGMRNLTHEDVWKLSTMADGPGPVAQVSDEAKKRMN